MAGNGNDHSAVCAECKSVQWCSKMVGKNPVLSGLHAQEIGRAHV